MVSKPRLSQIVELNQDKEMFLIVWKQGEVFCIKNEEAVKKFGDVEIHDLTIHLTGHYEEKNKTFRPRFEVIL